MTRVLVISILGLLVTWSCSGSSIPHAAQPRVIKSAHVATTPFVPPEPRDPVVAGLIHQLVSDFPPVHETGYWPPSEPGSTGVPGMLKPQRNDMPETPEQINAKRVNAAYERLRSLGLPAFPELVANSGDPRFAFARVYAAWHNHSVGDVCFMIMEEQVDFYGTGYKSRNDSKGHWKVKPQYLYAMRDSIGLQAWWEGHKTLSLREMQIESLRWTIREETEFGFVNDDERHRILDPLQKRLTELESPG